ncbi:MAG: hypothetical protein LBP59_18680 [Planctomycetaceae bacterium]|nr:hypothetical protein [Planctomycetaceae bacterium]
MFSLYLLFTFALLSIGRQTLTLLNWFVLEFAFTFARLAFGRQALTLLNQ